MINLFYFIFRFKLTGEDGDKGDIGPPGEKGFKGSQGLEVM